MFDDYARASGPDDTVFYADHDHGAKKRRGLRANEVPFRFSLLVPDEVIQAILHDLGCRELALLAPKQLATIGAILANLSMAPPGYTIFYSRDRNFYAALTRYLPKHCSYRRMLAAIELLSEHGLLHHRPTRPSPNARFRSCIWACARLAQRLELLPAARCINKPKEIIVLRGANKLPEPYPETAATERMRREVMELNAFLSQFHVSLEHPLAIQDNRGFWHVDGQRFNTSAPSSYRVFTQRFDQNGRFYGGFWQNLPSKIREKGLRIDGSPIVELDYRACHLRILCALAGWKMPFDDPAFDPFAGWKFERRLVKTAFVMLLNNRCRPGALAALARELLQGAGNESGRQPRAADYQQARELLEAVDNCFPFLDGYWCRGFGLRLLNIDAEICALNMRVLKGRGIPCLSVHDSFIVPVRHRDTLAGIMEESFREVTGHLS